MPDIKCVRNARFSPLPPQHSHNNLIDHVVNFHKKIPGYKPSPLVALQHLAKQLGVNSIYVKDESSRFNLNSFKALGGAYAIGNLLSHAAPTTFATATAGNHGIGIAWVAKVLKQRAVIFMPKDTPLGQVNTVKALGAQAVVTDVAYDETVEHAKQVAQKNGWHIVQDTAWEGYEQIPQWIMQGYFTLAYEMMTQFEADQHVLPTHIFLQAGVGSMAGGILDYLSDQFDLRNIVTVVTEPTTADCLFQSAINDHRTDIPQPVNSIMNGMACAVPNPIAWPILQRNTQYFVGVNDAIAELGMRLLQTPQAGDQQINSGPSGAVTAGLLHELMINDNEASVKDMLKLTSDSRILIINTENNPNTFVLDPSSDTACYDTMKIN